MKKALLSGLITAFLFISHAPAGALCVNVPEANLRGGPGTKYERTWQVFRYMPLKKLREKGGWYRVRDVDGDIHWIYGKLVTEEFSCGVVKVPEANIRSGPGTNHGKTAASPALRYYSFRIMKTRGDWVQVRDEYGVTGWIAKRLLWIQ
jgi:SH3-like domain-containing protein